MAYMLGLAPEGMLEAGSWIEKSWLELESGSWRMSGAAEESWEVL